jgi:RNA recognition motif-containing protein
MPAGIWIFHINRPPPPPSPSPHSPPHPPHTYIVHADTLRDIFNRDGFRVDEADIDKKGHFDRAFVTFLSSDDAQRAADEYDGAQLNNAAVNVRIFVPEGGGGGGGGGGRGSSGPPGITIVKRGDAQSTAGIKVNNIPSGLTDSDLKEIFATIGSVSDARVLTGRGVEFGLVSFSGGQARNLAERAVREFDRAQINGCEISVVIDQGPPPRGGGGSGGRW